MVRFQNAVAPSSEAKMDAFDYNREAELFPAGTIRSRRKGFSYRRFDRAAEAIQFAMEVLPWGSLAGAHLEVDEQRFDAEGIRLLYESWDYPLARSATRAASGPAARS
jgi:hypothetical protein